MIRVLSGLNRAPVDQRAMSQLGDLLSSAWVPQPDGLIFAHDSEPGAVRTEADLGNDVATWQMRRFLSCGRVPQHDRVSEAECRPRSTRRDLVAVRAEDHTRNVVLMPQPGHLLWCPAPKPGGFPADRSQPGASRAEYHSRHRGVMLEARQHGTGRFRPDTPRAFCRLGFTRRRRRQWIGALAQSGGRDRRRAIE